MERAGAPLVPRSKVVLVVSRSELCRLVVVLALDVVLVGLEAALGHHWTCAPILQLLVQL